MKSLLIASAITAASFGVSAQQGGYGDLPFQINAGVGDSKSRAEVLAELREAQAMGTIAYGDLPIQTHAGVGNSKSRAEVLAELREAQAMGAMAYGDLPIPSDRERTFALTRSEVKMEVTGLTSQHNDNAISGSRK